MLFAQEPPTPLYAGWGLFAQRYLPVSRSVSPPHKRVSQSSLAAIGFPR